MSIIHSNDTVVEVAFEIRVCRICVPITIKKKESSSHFDLVTEYIKLVRLAFKSDNRTHQVRRICTRSQIQNTSSPSDLYSN